MLVNEDGPKNIFKKIRHFFGVVWGISDITSDFRWISNKFIGQLLLCLWCTSVWVGAFWTVFYFFSPTISFYCSLPFSLSALAIVLEKFVRPAVK